MARCREVRSYGPDQAEFQVNWGEHRRSMGETAIPGAFPSAREIAVHYVYVLSSESDGLLYTGCTADLRERLKAHTVGRVPATKRRRPLKLIYYEACLSADDAFRREKYLKTAYGKRYLKSRLRCYFTGQAN